MDQLLKFLITGIVDNPDAVTITKTNDDQGTVILTASVAESDMGKIIGKGGKIINAIREIVKVKAAKQNQRVRVVLTEPIAAATQTNSLSQPIPQAESEDKS